MNRIAQDVDKIFIKAGYCDLRMGIDGLATLVQLEYNLDPQTNCLFLFCGRRSDRIKGLLWQGDGFLLLYKRIDKGRFKWPRNNNEVRELSKQQLKWLLEGLSVDQNPSIKRW